jgi:hypothetical protein
LALTMATVVSSILLLKPRSLWLRPGGVAALNLAARG